MGIVAVVGSIPTSLPPPSLPLSGAADVALVASNAVILAVINYVQTVSLALIFGKKRGETIDPPMEMLALGVSSFVGSCFSCYTIAGRSSDCIKNQLRINPQLRLEQHLVQLRKCELNYIDLVNVILCAGCR